MGVEGQHRERRLGGGVLPEGGARALGHCNEILELLGSASKSGSLISQATAAESKVFYHKMRGDYYRYIAEFKKADAKTQAAEQARQAYTEAMEVAKQDL